MDRPKLNNYAKVKIEKNIIGICTTIHKNTPDNTMARNFKKVKNIDD